MKSIKGICPIIATPFTKTGKVDYDSFENLVRVLVQGGCHAVALFGIAGEYYKLSDEEAVKMAHITVDTCRKYGGTTIISVTQHSTETAVERAKLYEDIGADCLMLLPPFFLKPDAAALYDHMKAVGQAVSIPVMAQYAPNKQVSLFNLLYLQNYLMKYQIFVITKLNVSLPKLCIDTTYCNRKQSWCLYWKCRLSIYRML